MKSPPYLAIFLTAISLIVISGCVSLQQDPVNKSAGQNNSSINAATSPSPIPSIRPDPVNASDTVDIGAFSWYEYRVKVGNNYRWYNKVTYDKQEYQGVVADHTNISYRRDDYSVPWDTYSITDLYYDDNGNFIGGSMVIFDTFEKGKPGEYTTVEVRNYTVSDTSTVNGLDVINNVIKSTPLTYEGLEMIDIDGKWYQCKKFLFDGIGQTTIWYSPETQLPVKFGFQSPIGDYSYELTGWG